MRAALLSLWMTNQSPNKDEFDTFTYNSPGVYNKMQDEVRLFSDLLPESARSKDNGAGMPYADAATKTSLFEYIKVGSSLPRGRCCWGRRCEPLVVD